MVAGPTVSEFGKRSDIDLVVGTIFQSRQDVLVADTYLQRATLSKMQILSVVICPTPKPFK
jgi:hypothetical protein